MLPVPLPLHLLKRSRAERISTSCSECRRRKQKVCYGSTCFKRSKYNRIHWPVVAQLWHETAAIAKVSDLIPEKTTWLLSNSRPARVEVVTKGIRVATVLDDFHHRHVNTRKIGTKMNLFLTPRHSSHSNRFQI
ncbi:uncharacterized protein BCR38DRAFT_110446 [Pseudomassariella vexata]|uniref:Uncharacterized protein n=1 Tax=Pseudomassariella vexata TaxID=1141098 RepID=A0A1Y2DDT6_9PEZI|nr:uncharacterized protein BCR38DRAFT_110446 [Pseudomassariella vexata]ORY57264.1 hypothetical protein BCR38DRAFT_110446 [Pseudomassariella vexata]